MTATQEAPGLTHPVKPSSLLLLARDLEQSKDSVCALFPRPSPSPHVSLLLLSPSSPAFVLSFRESRRWTATVSLLSACEPMLPLAGSGSPQQVISGGGRGWLHTIQNLVQQALPGFSQIYENDRSLNLILCSGWNPIVPVFSPLFSCCLFLFFSLICPSSLYLSFDLHTYTPISFILKTSCL